MSSTGVPAWKPIEVSRSKPGAYASGPEVIRTRPEHAAKMMAIIACWSGIEHLMTEIMGYVVDTDGWLAAELLHNVRKWKVRRRLLLDVVERAHGKGGLNLAKQSFDIALLSDLETQRDKLAHGTFVIPNQDPDLVIRSEGYGERVRWYGYRMTTLTAMLERFDDAARKVTHLWMIMVSFASARDHWRAIYAMDPPPSPEQLSKLLGAPGMYFGTLSPKAPPGDTPAPQPPAPAQSEPPKSES